MNVQDNAKDELAEQVRQALRQRLPNVRETNRADMSLCNLSFQSPTYPDWHVWIDTLNDIYMDLEDWSYEQTWDNAVARLTVKSVPEAADIVAAWLSGTSADEILKIGGELTSG